jgi:hypothetical protein
MFLKRPESGKEKYLRRGKGTGKGEREQEKIIEKSE